MEKKDKTVKIYQREKISFQLNLAQPNWTENQKKLIEIIKRPETQYVFIKGASGTSKTFISLAIGLELLASGRVKELILIRSIIESGMVSLGTLPGDTREKLEPYSAPYTEKLSELLPKEEIKKLHDDDRLKYMPVNYLRGRQFNASYMIFDEAQNSNVHEIQTALTRLGPYSKMILLGDVAQVDYYKGKKLESGFKTFYNFYNTRKELAEANGVYCFSFGIEDIMRNDVIKFIVEQYDELLKTIA